MSEPVFEPLNGYHQYEPEEMCARSAGFLDELRRRRTVRDFSSRDVPEAVIANCLQAAATAPSGANLQPWHFAVVRDKSVQRTIRVTAEEEERQFYEQRAPREWLEALRPLGTDANKPFLEHAPCLIVVFAKTYGISAGGESFKHYYATESVGIATGMLITALHHAGLATLTHTPSPMKFLNEALQRPRNERPFLILVVGFPSPDALVPKIEKKSFHEYTSFH